MFHVHGIQGRIFSGSLEQLRQQRLVAGVAGVRRVGAITAPSDPPAGLPTQARGAQQMAALQAYGTTASRPARQPLRLVADVMHAPVITVAADMPLREAWLHLDRHGIGQAPVLDAGGALVGLIGRAALAPAWATGPDHPARPVAEAMWSPVPSTAPDTDLRRVAALLLDTGLPGVPVADATGRLLGFVGRTDLLRALATDPPLDLWG